MVVVGLMQILLPPPSYSRETQQLSCYLRTDPTIHARGPKTRSIPGCSGSYSYSIVLVPHLLPSEFVAPMILSFCSSPYSRTRMTGDVMMRNGPWKNYVANDWLSFSYASWPDAYDDW